MTPEPGRVAEELVGSYKLYNLAGSLRDVVAGGEGRHLLGGPHGRARGWLGRYRRRELERPQRNPRLVHGADGPNAPRQEGQSRERHDDVKGTDPNAADADGILGRYTRRGPCRLERQRPATGLGLRLVVPVVSSRTFRLTDGSERTSKPGGDARRRRQELLPQVNHQRRGIHEEGLDLPRERVRRVPGSPRAGAHLLLPGDRSLGGERGFGMRTPRQVGRAARRKHRRLRRGSRGLKVRPHVRHPERERTLLDRRRHVTDGPDPARQHRGSCTRHARVQKLDAALRVNHAETDGWYLQDNLDG